MMHQTRRANGELRAGVWRCDVCTYTVRAMEQPAACAHCAARTTTPVPRGEGRYKPVWRIVPHSFGRR